MPSTFKLEWYFPLSLSKLKHFLRDFHCQIYPGNIGAGVKIRCLKRWMHSAGLIFLCTNLQLLFHRSPVENICLAHVAISAAGPNIHAAVIRLYFKRVAASLGG